MSEFFYPPKYEALRATLDIPRRTPHFPSPLYPLGLIPLLLREGGGSDKRPALILATLTDIAPAFVAPKSPKNMGGGEEKNP